MTVIADDKKRVTLPTKPGERFDVKTFGEDKFVLTRLAPMERIIKVKLNRQRFLPRGIKFKPEDIAAAIRDERDNA